MIDLHTHSTCSDGSEPPERVVDLAKQAGCRAIALTDHDGCFGLAAARGRAESIGMRFVPGCEVSCTHRTISLHLLCYFVDETSRSFDELLQVVRRDRDERNRAIDERLGELGMAVSLDDATAEAKGEVVGRPHFAAVLVRRGMANSIEDAFDRWLGDGRPAYVARTPLPPGRVIDAARQDGGVVALAHPLSSGKEFARLALLVDELAEMGLAGLEAYYATYDEKTHAQLVELARSHGLVPTGGSDFHGEYRPGIRVGVGAGDLDVPDAILDELEDHRR
ncbi:MAG: PHP domain-containing protein [Acidimicrobiales bacterium]